jgi:hypothetical protein
VTAVLFNFRFLYENLMTEKTYAKVCVCGALSLSLRDVHGFRASEKCYEESVGTQHMRCNKTRRRTTQYCESYQIERV